MDATGGEIHPTHTCFDDSLDLFIELLQANGPGSEQQLRLVHAICTSPTGTDFAHAWVEDIERDIAIFTGILNGERTYFAGIGSEYRELHGVKELIRYSYVEAYRLNRSSGHYGPWAPEYRALCANGPERQVWR